MKHAGSRIVETPFHNTGLYNIDGKGAYPEPNRGILELSGKAADMGAFRTQSLRNVLLLGLGEARELLHEALVRNPQDAASMLMLANIYLDSNEDPAMAELLARKSAGLHDRPEAWQALARALRKLGREEEARVAEAKAVLS